MIISQQIESFKQWTGPTRPDLTPTQLQRYLTAYFSDNTKDRDVKYEQFWMESSNLCWQHLE